MNIIHIDKRKQDWDSVLNKDEKKITESSTDPVMEKNST